VLLEEFKSFTTKAHGFFGRSWAEFCKARNEALANIDSRKTVEEISQDIKTGLKEAPHHQKSLNALKTRLGKSASTSKAVVSRLRSAENITPNLREKLTEELSSLELLLVEAEEVIDRLFTYLEKIDSLSSKGQVLEDRVDGLRRQMDDMYETVALGLTAEALSHEIYNVADQLARRAKSAQKVLRNKGITDRPVLAFVEYVHSSVMALRKNKITMKVMNSESESFTVRMNKGKLTQVIDNLVLNSEYWLKEDIVQKRLDGGVITLEISRPFIRVFDNGSGIDTSVENALFEPFVSAKSKGRGLGLFIVKQLLDSEGCSIGLVPKRNRRRRLYTFQIDLRGALHE